MANYPPPVPEKISKDEWRLLNQAPAVTNALNLRGVPTEDEAGKLTLWKRIVTYSTNLEAYPKPSRKKKEGPPRKCSASCDTRHC